jgi:addiction module RelB/DinJ family antitoxin
LEVNAVFRARVNKQLLQRAQRICQEMGLDIEDAVRLFLNELVRQRRLPFSLDEEILQYERRRAAILDSFYSD